jgi:hypothetical protein
VASNVGRSGALGFTGRLTSGEFTVGILLPCLYVADGWALLVRHARGQEANMGCAGQVGHAGRVSRVRQRAALALAGRPSSRFRVLFFVFPFVIFTD